MGCCATHDRMDTILASDEVNSRRCGVPTNPRGERRYCCLHCPTQGQSVESLVEPEWAQNPFLSQFVSPEILAQELAGGLSAGVNILQPGDEAQIKGGESSGPTIV